jgi:hypothetical protein
MSKSAFVNEKIQAARESRSIDDVMAAMEAMWDFLQTHVHSYSVSSNGPYSYSPYPRTAETDPPSD